VPVFLIGEVIGDCPAINTPPHQKTTRGIVFIFPFEGYALKCDRKIDGGTFFD